MASLICPYGGESHDPQADDDDMCRECGRELVPRDSGRVAAESEQEGPLQPENSMASPRELNLVFPWGEFALRQGDDVMIGRGHPPVATYLQEYPNVSGDHARIDVADRVEVTDLESTNGTYIDGQRIEPGVARTVDPGQVLSFSRTLRAQLVSRDDPSS